MEKNLDYYKYLPPPLPPPPSTKLLRDGLILAMLALKLLLNNKLGKNLAKEEYLPFTTGLIAMSSREKRSFIPVVFTPSFSKVEPTSKL